MTFYNFDKINAAGMPLNFIVGARRIGKTYCAMRTACEAYNEDRSQSVWLRNFKTEIEDENFQEKFLVDMVGSGIASPDWIVKPTGVYVSRDRNADKVIHFQSVNVASASRGGASPRVKLMFFDEFMPEDRRYPVNAPKKLISLTKTFFSGRKDCRAYCLSNFISSGNPYFASARIFPDKKLDVTVFRDKGIAVEVCRGYDTAVPSDSPWNAVYGAFQYADYAEPTEDSLFDLIATTKAKTEDWFIHLSINRTIYTAKFDRGIMYWRVDRNKFRPEQEFITPEKSEVSDRVKFISPWIAKMLKESFIAGTLRFDDPNTMYSILSIVFKTV